jgi:hypothetical protein
VSGDLVDVLHAAGVPGFVYVPGVDPPVATIKGGIFTVHGPDHWWASCRPCWWWDEDDGLPTARSAAVAQARADAHNLAHHAKEAPCPG